MINGLLPLIILGGIVALIVKAVTRNNGDTSGESGTVTIRRFFQYVTLFGVLVVVAIGLTGLIEQLLPVRGTVIRRDSTTIARSVSFLIVGIPVYLALGAWVRRQLELPGERASLGFSFYMTASQLTGLFVAGYSAYELLTWAFGAEEFDSSSLGRGIVWGAVWVTHWLIAARFVRAPRGQGHLLGGSAAGLITLTGSTGYAITIILDALYSNLFEVGVVSQFGADIGRAGAAFIIGGAIWWLYWLQSASRLERTAFWHAYVVLLGVLSGLMAAIGAGTTLLYVSLEWFFGTASEATAAQQFAMVPGLIATALVGLGVFFYHRAVLAEAGETHRSEVRRVYDYVVAAVGLLSFSGGVAVLLVALIQQLSPTGTVVAGDSEVNTLIGAVTFLVVGVPIWWLAWSRIQRFRAAEPTDELRSVSRRAYLFLLFGVGGVVALISLLVAMFAFLEDLLGGRFGAQTISDIAPGIALVITTGAVAWYHWVVYREDRADLPETALSQLKEVILLGVLGDELAKAIPLHFDAKVTQWERLDGPGGEVDTELVMAELGRQTGERVIVVVSLEGHSIVPFASRRSGESTSVTGGHGETVNRPVTPGTRPPTAPPVDESRI